MDEIQSSALLQKIMQRAEALRKDNACSALTRDYIVLAAISVLDEADGADEEYVNTKNLLESFSREKAFLADMLAKWRNKQVPMTEGMILSAKKGKSLHAARQSSKKQLTADLFMAEILRDYVSAAPRREQAEKQAEEPRRPMAEPQGSQAVARAPEAPEAAPQESGKPLAMSEIVQKTKQLRSALQARVLGQQHAVSLFASGYFQSELQASIQQNRKRPRATFLFAGPPGVGKTFLSEEAARVLALPFRRFDMSEYTGPSAINELSGSDANYVASSEGLLTGFVSKNPQCVLLFDEIEKASLEVIHLFLQILDAGRLRDNRTDQEVDFKDTLLIFTTNAGKDLYDGEESGNLSAVSREVILDALSKDINPRTNEPFFPAAICSRFASGNVVMFNHLEASSLKAIVERELNEHVQDISKAMGIQVTVDPDVPTALLLAEGAMADARTVKSRAASFFSGELYELFRLISSEERKAAVESIHSIRFTVNREGEAQEAARLFAPEERIHALAYGREQLPLPQDDSSLPVLHAVQDFQQAQRVIAQESIQLVFCDLFSDELLAGGDYLHLEDRNSAARDFLQSIRKQYPGLSVVLTEPAERAFTEEEKISYLRNGVSGFLSLTEGEPAEAVRRFTERIFQQNCMAALARSNQLLRYETAQRLNAAGDAAEIILFDMRLEKAIKAEDAGNVMSLLSTPDVKFDDVIGADDAKNELKFFVSYMKQPKRYRRFGVSAPKGVLLYGPPGTGKTMLAKAFAAESQATFIATEGNQFFKGIVGQGAAMVHRLFATARRYAPSVIFIDEIDTIARARSGRDTDMAQDNEQILTALFAEMDGFSTPDDKPVFVLGATNYQVDDGARMRLDPAILRRFDRRILVDLPNQENRRAYLKAQTDKKEIFQLSRESIESIADRSAGMSLAQLSSILDMAIRTAMQKQLERVDAAVLDEAFETFNSGESRKWDAETTLRTARHEAGHALISWLSGEMPSFVTIVSRGNFGGYMQYADQEERMGYTKRELLDRIRTSMGGRAAEMVYYGSQEGLSTGASSDLRKATAIARQIICAYGMDEQFGLAVMDQADEPLTQAVQAQINGLLRAQLEEAVEKIQANREKMDLLVNQLLERNSLRANDIDNIMNL